MRMISWSSSVNVTDDDKRRSSRPAECRLDRCHPAGALAPKAPKDNHVATSGPALVAPARAGPVVMPSADDSWPIPCRHLVSCCLNRGSSQHIASERPHFHLIAIGTAVSDHRASAILSTDTREDRQSDKVELGNRPINALLETAGQRGYLQPLTVKDGDPAVLKRDDLVLYPCTELAVDALTG